MIILLPSADFSVQCDTDLGFEDNPRGDPPTFQKHNSVLEMREACLVYT